MKYRLAVFMTGLSMTGMACADSGQTEDYKTLVQSVKQLQHEVDSLKSELAEQKKSRSSAKLPKHRKPKEVSPASDINTVINSSDDSLTYLPMDFSVPGKSFVSSGPYIGVPIAYSGGHLIINSPSVNQDYTLLRLRYNIRNRLHDLGITEPSSGAHLLLSGLIEGQGVYQSSGAGSSSSDINLSAAGIDAYILGPGQWLSGLIALSYDGSSGASEGTFANNSRTLNSRVYVNQAFITVGRLAITSFYGTIGQLYVPFGTFSSNMVSPALTKSLARTKARTLVIGYQPLTSNTFYTAGYVFQGDSHTGSAPRVNNGGVNLGYHFASGNFNGDVGTGVIANLADSVGMQNTGNTSNQFNGFGGTGNTGNEEISHRVPALDFRGMVSAGEHVNLLAEYITATTAFAKTDLTQNGHGAKPQALNAEAAYTFNTFTHPCSIAAGYGMTKDSLALGIPLRRYSLAFNTSIWRETLQGIEFKHEVNYPSSASATGSGIPAPASNGRADNVVTAQFDLFF